MAVVVARARSLVAGDRRWMLLNVNIGATGQTLTSPLHDIDQPQADGSGTVAIEASIPVAGGGGPITFNYSGGGAQNNVDVLVIGR